MKLSMVDEPTDKGRHEFPPDGYYEGIPCTCHEKCNYACEGKGCGCKAHRACYGEFLDGER